MLGRKTKLNSWFLLKIIGGSGLVSSRGESNISNQYGLLFIYYLLNALSRPRRKVIHVSFACAVPHGIIKFVA